MLSNVFYFLQGYTRYYLVRLFGWWVLRGHIGDQIIARAQSARRECVNGGSCVLCGCHTPALFYADKACDRPCYPKMMGRHEWKVFVKRGGDRDWIYHNGKFHKVKEVIDERVF